ncbi:Predicted anti-sigma F protein (E-sigma F) [Desulfamplus magnetovallimortis]|uniref:Predicted anti-sigma F protein (E-sigma F) n=1 Tax=Desulfamplus magnetovallimortis TaxID=1246637 RepID=L0R768_9BACT|nr:ATP-binding protein [Desulfamplus magnetovallimortis]CCO06806.1 Predicted anti-sigma F protein (E-sigma F) [Desulfamplus magnetovallimortis BW-1]SLM32857.1 Predicted anti-sigma F protein (E-sigma F) [Desulfamplus magnetovallimortis]
MISSTWSATLDSLISMQEHVSSLAVEAGATAKQSLSISLIVEEIAVNIINYAYDTEESQTITIEFDKDSDHIYISFIDTGYAFDPLSAEEPDTTKDLNDRQIGGLGLFLVKQMADDIKYNRCDNKNILTVTLNLTN